MREEALRGAREACERGERAVRTAHGLVAERARRLLDADVRKLRVRPERAVEEGGVRVARGLEERCVDAREDGREEHAAARGRIGDAIRDHGSRDVAPPSIAGRQTADRDRTHLEPRVEREGRTEFDRAPRVRFARERRDRGLFDRDFADERARVDRERVVARLA